MRAPPLRALAVPLDRTSTRRWYRPAREPLPPEPGRLLVCALLARARRARGCSTPGDDRLETRVYAVKRYAYRLGHAARSARFATSVEQLVVGLAPVMGWGPAPCGKAARARFVRAHRRSVQRWLDDLQAAGLVAHEPEKDGDGSWWRTQLVLLAAPVASDAELRAARSRARGWAAREGRRRRRARLAPSLGAIRARSRVPRSATRARHASGLLAHPFGEELCSAQSLHRNETVVDWTGARVDRDHSRRGGEPANGCTEEVARLSRDDFDALVERLLAVRNPPGGFQDLHRSQLDARVAEVLRWPTGRICPLGRIREAWAAQRYGLARVAQCGAADARSVPPQLVGRAVHLYEAHAEARPPGWPESGAAALCTLASQHRAATLAGDVSRLLALAKAMRAVALEHDPARLDRARMRADRRRLPPSTLFTFRLGRARLETPEQRRQRVRDAVLLGGGNPATWPNAELARGALPSRHPEPELTDPDRFEELDGHGARATRYRADLARGVWELASSD